MTDHPQFTEPVFTMPTVQRPASDPPPVDMPTVQRPADDPPPVDMPTFTAADIAPERDEEAVAQVPAAHSPTPGADAGAHTDGPQPLFAGTYAIHDDTQGGFVLVIWTREGETHHQHIPARMWKWAEKMMGDGSPFSSLFSGLFGGF